MLREITEGILGESLVNIIGGVSGGFVGGIC